jgi:hypothetical protein
MEHRQASLTYQQKFYFLKELFLCQEAKDFKPKAFFVEIYLLLK